MAGVVGFEPTIHGTKNRCLTTWLHPNGERLSTIVAGGVQELLGKNIEQFEQEQEPRSYSLHQYRSGPVTGVYQFMRYRAVLHR